MTYLKKCTMNCDDPKPCKKCEDVDTNDSAFKFEKTTYWVMPIPASNGGHISHTLGGFKGAFVVENGARPPTEQEIFDAGVRSGMERANKKDTQPEPATYTDEWINEQFRRTVLLSSDGERNFDIDDIHESITKVLRFFGNRVLMEFGSAEGMYRAFSESYERDRLAKQDSCWRDMDSAPKDGEKIILLGSNGECVSARWDGYEWCPNGVFVSHDMASVFIDIGKPIKWMPRPLPPAPKAHDQITRDAMQYGAGFGKVIDGKLHHVKREDVFLSPDEIAALTAPKE